MNIFTVILTAIVIFAAAAVLNSIFVYFLWNAVMPQIFGLPIISSWQALLLSCLSQVLIKSHNFNTSSKD